MRWTGNMAARRTYHPVRSGATARRVFRAETSRAAPEPLPSLCPIWRPSRVPAMSIEHPTPGAALDALVQALTQLRALAAAPSADPIYAQAAEQVAAIVADLQQRAGATAAGTAVTPQAPILDPVPPDPG